MPNKATVPSKAHKGAILIPLKSTVFINVFIKSKVFILLICPNIISLFDFDQTHCPQNLQ